MLMMIMTIVTMMMVVGDDVISLFLSSLLMMVVGDDDVISLFHSSLLNFLQHMELGKHALHPFLDGLHIKFTAL